MAEPTSILLLGEMKTFWLVGIEGGSHGTLGLLPAGCEAEDSSVIPTEHMMESEGPQLTFWKGEKKIDMGKEKKTTKQPPLSGSIVTNWQHSQVPNW